MFVPRHTGAARARAVGAIVVLAACRTPKPPAPTVYLPPATDTVSAPFHDVAGAVWVGPDRWAVVSEGGGAVSLVSFRPRTLSPFASAGRKLLQNPFAAFRAADSIYVADWGLRRLTVWGLDGRLGRTIPAPEGTHGALPRARDAQGRFYVPVTPAAGPDGSGNRDSASVLRTASDFSRIDTLLRLAPADVALVQSEAGQRFERRVFSGSDLWGVLPDGSAWVARVYQNRVEWHDPTGRVTRGDPLPDRVLEVSRADREFFVRSFPPELRSTAEQLPFAAIKPPFTAGFTGADGLVWLEKSRSIVDSAGSYHVVDRAGRLLREIRIRGPARILAATGSAALAVEPDGDHLRLMQVTLPAATAAR